MRVVLCCMSILALAGCGPRSRVQPGPCEDDPCGDHATCVERDGEAHCDCDAGYENSGEGCVLIVECPLGCWGHGTCRIDDDGEPVCECDPGYHLEGSTACVADEEELVSDVCSDSGFCWEHPFPQGNPLAALWAFSGDDVWAVGSGGVAIHWDGESWSGSFEAVQGNQSIRSSFSTWFQDLWGSSSTDLWVLGQRGDETTETWESEILHWDGSSWSNGVVPLAEGEVVSAVFGFGPDDVWFVGASGLCFHWDGEQRQSFELGTSSSLFGLWGAAADDLWAVGNESTIFHWDGDEWSDAGEPVADSNIAIWGTGPDDAWIVGSAGLARHWDGTSWTRVDTGLGDVHLSQIWGSSPSNYWAAGEGIYHWDGDSWTQVDIDDGGRFVMGIFGTDAGDVWSVTESGWILRWTGEAWRRLDSRFEVNWAEGEYWNDLWPGGEGSAPWAVAGDGTVVRRGHQGWELVERTSEALYSVYASAADDVWVGGDGFLLNWDGSGWTSYEDIGRGHDIWGTGGQVWAAMAGVLEWTGDNWHETACEFCPPVTMIAGTSADTVFGAGIDGRTRFFDGEIWSSVDAPEEGSYGSLSCVPDEACFILNQSEGTIYEWDGEWLRHEGTFHRDMMRLWAESESSMWAICLDSSRSHGSVSHWSEAPGWDELLPLGGVVADYSLTGSYGASPRVSLWNVHGDILRRDL